VIFLILTSRTPSAQKVAQLADTHRIAEAAAQAAAEAKAALRHARAAARRRACVKRSKVPIPRPVLLFTRSRKGRWRCQRVPIFDSFIATEGSA
jgi:hypothetical protein